MPCVIATIEDFEKAAELFIVLNGTTGGQGTKLTRREAGLIEIFLSYGQSEITIAQMQPLSGWTSSSIAKLLHGYRSYGKTYSGLLEKCPAISYLDQTVTKGDEGKTTMRRTTAYLWDTELYLAWKKGGSVWLASEDDPGHDPHDGNDPDEFESLEENKVLNPCVSEKTREPIDILQSVENLSSESPDHECSLSSITLGNFVRLTGCCTKTCSSLKEKGPLYYLLQLCGLKRSCIDHGASRCG
jgi:hypothetical protein